MFQTSLKLGETHFTRDVQKSDRIWKKLGYRWYIYHNTKLKHLFEDIRQVAVSIPNGVIGISQ